MSVTKINIANVGSPSDDPTLQLKGILYVPKFPQPWNAMVGTSSPGFRRSNIGVLDGPFMDLASNGYICLAMQVRADDQLLPGQKTDGKWPEQMNDLKAGVRAMRADPFGFGYNVTGRVAALGGSGSANLALSMALDGTDGDDKADAAVCMSPPTDFSDRSPGVPAGFISDVVLYGRTTDLPTLLSRSPISLPLATANPILHFNGDNEHMPLTQLTGFKKAMLDAGVTNYTSVINTGALGKDHSFAMYSGVADQIKAWLDTNF